MHSAKIDVPVLLIFFCRPQTTAKVFEQIKRARPSKLFLYQDGPRTDRPDDLAKVMECRRIVEDIDWECEVNKCYQDKNVGCDPSEFIAQKWAFNHVDRCIVLEDDDVPALSFFPFCAELLERYKDDERINIICGLNHLGTKGDVPYDYFFSPYGSITGWASWKRVIDTWEEHYDYLDDEYAMRIVQKLPACMDIESHRIVDAKRKRQQGVPYYETLLGASNRLHSRLNIVPTKNMISNIGLGEDAAHTTSGTTEEEGGMFNMKTYDVVFPLKHPKYIVCDIEHVMAVDDIFGRRLTFWGLWKRRVRIIWKLRNKPNVLLRRLKRRVGR